ncbi:hypothetical protein IQ266_15910 [filamentous cyanobacterium LEGE 11480]|uniref:Uncharacterized protein n=1 Tax=Romeriopsis navalis LEGE 11480 TaxID=2777977 RepID=A0A928Z5F6_9CYAN|nr:hypothetical protein [Romeriopsis navalis]MBE9031220.1 hypothetical protein [Romeriopsis navalis LEGE 11480]
MVKWDVLIGKIITWFVIELVIDAAGLDQIADYGEFLEDQFHQAGQVVMLNSYKI